MKKNRRSYENVIRKYVLGNDYKDGEKFWWSKDKFGTTDVYDDRQD